MIAYETKKHWILNWNFFELATEGINTIDLLIWFDFQQAFRSTWDSNSCQKNRFDMMLPFEMQFTVTNSRVAEGLEITLWFVKEAAARARMHAPNSLKYSSTWNFRASKKMWREGVCTVTILLVLLVLGFIQTTDSGVTLDFLKLQYYTRWIAFFYCCKRQAFVCCKNIQLVKFLEESSIWWFIFSTNYCEVEGKIRIKSTFLK